MCQTSVYMEKNGGEELLLENVTTMEAIDNGYKVSTLFEGPRDFADVAIRRIDFSGGRVFFYQKS